MEECSGIAASVTESLFKVNTSFNRIMHNVGQKSCSEDF